MGRLMVRALLLALVAATLAGCDALLPSNDGSLVVRNGSDSTFHIRLARGPDAAVTYRVGPGETGRAVGPPGQGRITSLTVFTEGCDELASASDPAPGLMTIEGDGNITFSAGTPADAAGMPPLTPDPTCP